MAHGVLVWVRNIEKNGNGPKGQCMTENGWRKSGGEKKQGHKQR